MSIDKLDALTVTLAERVAALEVENKLLASELVDAWSAAVDWAAYAGEYFQQKHGLEDDEEKLRLANNRMAEINSRNAQP